MSRCIGYLLLIVSCIGVLTFESCVSDKLEDPNTAVSCDTVSYSQDITPLVNQFCSPCHSSGSTISIELDNYTNLKEAADNRSLRTRVLVQRDMPQNGPLSLRYQKILDCWLNSGAPNN